MVLLEGKNTHHAGGSKGFRRGKRTAPPRSERQNGAVRIQGVVPAPLASLKREVQSRKHVQGRLVPTLGRMGAVREASTSSGRSSSDTGTVAVPMASTSVPGV